MPRSTTTGPAAEGGARPDASATRKAIDTMRAGVLILAALAFAALAVRWRRLGAGSRTVVVVAAVGLAVWGSGAIQPPDLEAIARDLGATLGVYTYPVVGLFAFLETGAGIGLVAPGELAVAIGGVTAGQGHTQLEPLIPIVWACAFAGDLTSFVLGRRLGREFLIRHGAVLKLTSARLEQVEGFLHRHGGKTILVGRFIGLVRALAPFVAGASKMPARRFVPVALLAAGIWSAAFTTLGYLFWQSFAEVETIAQRGSFALIGVVVAVAILVALYRLLRTPERRARFRAGLRVSARAAQRPSRSRPATVRGRE